jgi:predicted Fe-Mo cluster-binding NifX family protein
MKIAIPSDDRVTISTHFGRTRGFLVYDIADRTPAVDGYRERGEAGKHACACNSAERPTTHQTIIDALDGCKIVIARGMGPQMYDDLLSCGIDVFLTDTATAQAAVEQYIADSLPERAGLGCIDHIECEQHH